ncbi:MAG TPA: DUF4387 domain-containing protein [Acidimicrobiales bacterium]|nr:DUF4387 domain-containing protein [Acidimicrobiales bacterium]
MSDARTIGEVAHLVRSKNAGPFWQTLDVFLDDDASFDAVAQAPVLDPAVIGPLYRVDPATVRIFRLPSIRVVKISFPRRAAQGGIADRDMHAGQQHVPLARLRLDGAP